MKVMISLPMNGKNDDEVRARMAYLKNEFAKLHIEVVDSFITDEIEGSNYPGVYYLGRTLMKFMHNVDAVYFDNGWLEARGCRIENAICQEYGIKILKPDFLFEPRMHNVMMPPQPHIKNCMDTSKVVSLKNNFKDTND